MSMSTETRPADSPGRPDAEERLARLLTAVRELRSAWRDVTRATFPAGSTGFSVLNLVAQRGPARVSDLATCGHVGVSTMSRHVADLTAAGLLDRDIDPGDGRTHLVRLTAEGEDALRQARALVLSRLAPALDGWTDEEVSNLECQLSRLTQDLTTAVGRSSERTS